MATILFVYSTTDGHTKDICLRLKSVIEPDQHQVVLASIQDCDEAGLAAFDKIVIGASIRYGKHNPQVAAFIERNERILDSKPNAFFSVNVVARKPDKNRPDTNPYLKKFIRQINWRPQQLAVFAGKISYPKYRFFDRMMIRLIMWITKGPTDTRGVFEFTDWKKVDAFGQMVSKM